MPRPKTAGRTVSDRQLLWHVWHARVMRQQSLVRLISSAGTVQARYMKLKKLKEYGYLALLSRRDLSCTRVYTVTRQACAELHGAGVIPNPRLPRIPTAYLPLRLRAADWYARAVEVGVNPAALHFREEYRAALSWPPQAPGLLAMSLPSGFVVLLSPAELQVSGGLRALSQSFSAAARFVVVYDPNDSVDCAHVHCHGLRNTESAVPVGHLGAFLRALELEASGAPDLLEHLLTRVYGPLQFQLPMLTEHFLRGAFRLGSRRYGYTDFMLPKREVLRELKSFRPDGLCAGIFVLVRSDWQVSDVARCLGDAPHVYLLPMSRPDSLYVARAGVPEPMAWPEGGVVRAAGT